MPDPIGNALQNTNAALRAIMNDAARRRVERANERLGMAQIGLQRQQIESESALKNAEFERDVYMNTPDTLFNIFEKNKDNLSDEQVQGWGGILNQEHPLFPGTKIGDVLATPNNATNMVNDIQTFAYKQDAQKRQIEAAKETADLRYKRDLEKQRIKINADLKKAGIKMDEATKQAIKVITGNSYFEYPDTDEGKKALIKEINDLSNQFKEKPGKQKFTLTYEDPEWRSQVEQFAKESGIKNLNVAENTLIKMLQDQKNNNIGEWVAH